MKLATLTQDSWMQFCSWHAAPPPLPDRAVLVKGDDGALLAGACIYQTSGEFMLVERLAADPKAPKRRIHEAVLFIAAVVFGEAQMAGKFPLVFVSLPSIAKILAQKGWNTWQGAVMMRDPSEAAPAPAEPEQDPEPSGQEPEQQPEPQRRRAAETPRKKGVGSRTAPKNKRHAPLSDFEE